MANIILPQVNILSEINDSTKLMVEQDGQINRYPIADLDIGGGDVTIDLASGINSVANPIDADTLNGYKFNYFASKNDLNDYATAEQVKEIIANLPKENLDIKLNYSVVGGTTQPTNPTQNMIWINTNIPIGKVFFNKNRPEEQLVNGDIWICTGTSSTASFNALKINNDYIDTIYPRYAKQMQNNNLIDVTAMSYLNNKWINWVNELILYSNGTLNTDYTASGTITKQTNYLEFKTLQTVNTFGQNVIFSQDFNSDAYSKVYINYDLVNNHLLSGTLYQSHELILCDEYNNIIITAALNSSGHTEIDLSTVVGVNCYIGLRSYIAKNWSSGTMTTITNIYDLGVAV